MHPTATGTLTLLLLASSSAAQDERSFERANRWAANPRALSLAYADFDTRGGEPHVPSDLRAQEPSADELGTYLVQIEGPITGGKQDRLRAHVAALFDYVPNNAFIVRASASQIEALSELDVVSWVGDYHPAYRLDERLREAGPERRVVVHTFPGASRRELEARMRAAGARILESHPVLDRTLFVASAGNATTRRLARIPDVQWIEPEGVLTPRNGTTQWVIQTNVPGNTRIWSMGIHGENQIIGHIDGSIRTGSCFFDDPANPIGPNHRKLVYNAGSGADLHGTHTAGTLAGDAQPITGSTQDRGMAWAARIAHTSGLPFSTFNAVATTHHDHGARMHSNSWGDNTTTAYNTLCNQIDLFQWNNEEDLVFFAVTDLSSVRNPENAKNSLAVAASFQGASAGAKCSGGVGPTADGRRKPEILAPGCGIDSAGSSVCTTVNLSGTSMACPAVAAAGSLVRQYFEEGFYPSGAAQPEDGFSPTGALVKALLLNGSQNMATPGYPGNEEGWGRVNLDESLFFASDTSRLFVDDVRRANGLSTGQSSSYEITVTSSTPKLEITLAFTDFPGTVGASDPVVNDLDLVVTAPSGTQYLGNVFGTLTSIPGGTADRRNNVERVEIATPAQGLWTVRVLASNVVQGPQGYGLVVSGPFQLCNPAIATYCTAKPGLACGTPAIGAFGLPSVSSSSLFFIFAGPTATNASGLLLYSSSGAGNSPFQGGTLCVDTQGLRRSVAVSSGGFGTCGGEFGLDMNAFAQGNAGGNPDPFLTQIGTQVHAQWWGRDTLATGSFLSDGLRYVVCD
jgi:hypothetical protein